MKEKNFKSRSKEKSYGEIGIEFVAKLALAYGAEVIVNGAAEAIKETEFWKKKAYPWIEKMYNKSTDYVRDKTNSAKNIVKNLFINNQKS